MDYGKATRKTVILLFVTAILFLPSCSVTITPIKETLPKTKHRVIHRYYKGSKIPPRPSPSPSLIPLPPDDRVMDIIKQLEKEKKL